ncbi:MAG TPA: YciI family protein [Thermoleophilaceae bacterium]|nr:YciI family protein [Thermoleophilaceae bacterium]
MKYMLLINQGDAPTPRDLEAWGKLFGVEQQAIYADYQAINQTPGVTSGLALQPAETATTVRVEDGQTLTTDGPFGSVKEALGGYLLFEASDLDAAIELAARIPAARLGGAVEVRPVVEG